MNPDQLISHEGVVVKSSGRNVRVKITALSACSSCHAKGTCTAADMEEKYIDAWSDRNFREGDRVTVILEKKLGWVALFYGIILPFIILVTVLAGLTLAGKSETISAITALLSLIPYYILLHFFSPKIEKKFSFKAESSAIDNTRGDN